MTLTQIAMMQEALGVMMQEALGVMFEEGNPQDLKVLGLIDRLLADDWSGTGVYEALDAALKQAESDPARAM